MVDQAVVPAAVSGKGGTEGEVEADYLYGAEWPLRSLSRSLILSYQCVDEIQCG